MTMDSVRYEDNLETLEYWSNMNPSLNIYTIRDLLQNYNLNDIEWVLPKETLDLSFVGFFIDMTIEKTSNDQDVYTWRGSTNDGPMIHDFTLSFCPEDTENCITYAWDSEMFHVFEVYSSDGLLNMQS